MGFGRRKKKWTTIVLIVLIVLIIASAGVFAYLMINKKMESIENNYKGEIEDLKFKQYEAKKMVYVPIVDLKAGEVINKNMVVEKEIVLDLDNKFLMKEDDLGKVLVTDVSEGIPIFKNMLLDELIPNDVREMEFNMLLIQSNLSKSDYVDVRIDFPNADDYIVLSKKRIRGIDYKQNTIFLWLDEEEIMTINSAIVDCYLTPGTKIYTVPYVAPNIQELAMANYPVKLNVLSLIKKDANIVQIAKTVLNENVRSELDKRIALIDEMHSNKMNSAIQKETKAREEKVNEGINISNQNQEKKDKNEKADIKDQSKENDAKVIQNSYESRREGVSGK